MTRIYYRKITNKEINPFTDKEWTINDVPERWRNEVQAILDEGVSDGN